MNKDPLIRVLTQTVCAHEPRWVVMDHWEDDPHATAFADPARPRRLVYVSTTTPGRFYFACEEPNGPEETDFIHADEGEVYSVMDVVDRIERHLRKASLTPISGSTLRRAG